MYNLVYFFTTLLLFIILIYLITYNFNETQNNIQKNLKNLKKVDRVFSKSNPYEECQSGALTSQQCWEQRVFKCPRYNGSYKQCTNNYVPEPRSNYCSCTGFRDVCPWPYELNSTCFNKEVGNPIPKEFKHPVLIENNVHNPPRINIYNSDTPQQKSIFFTQCG